MAAPAPPPGTPAAPWRMSEEGYEDGSVKSRSRSSARGREGMATTSHDRSAPLIATPTGWFGSAPAAVPASTAVPSFSVQSQQISQSQVSKFFDSYELTSDTTIHRLSVLSCNLSLETPQLPRLVCFPRKVDRQLQGAKCRLLPKHLDSKSLCTTRFI